MVKKVLRLLGKTKILVDFTKIVLATSWNLKYVTVPGVSQNVKG